MEEKNGSCSGSGTRVVRELPSLLHYSLLETIEGRNGFEVDEAFVETFYVPFNPGRKGVRH